MLARLALSLSALSYALVLPVLELRAPAALDMADGSLHLYRSWHLLTLISLGAYALTRLWWQRDGAQAHWINLLAISSFFAAAALDASQGRELLISSAHGISPFGYQLAALGAGLIATLLARAMRPPAAAPQLPAAMPLPAMLATEYQSPERWLPSDRG